MYSYQFINICFSYRKVRPWDFQVAVGFQVTNCSLKTSASVSCLSKHRCGAGGSCCSVHVSGTGTWRHLYLQIAEVKCSPRKHGGGWQLGAWTWCLWHRCGHPHGCPHNRGHPYGHPHLLCHPHGFFHGCPSSCGHLCGHPHFCPHLLSHLCGFPHGHPCGHPCPCGCPHGCLHLHGHHHKCPHGCPHFPHHGCPCGCPHLHGCPCGCPYPRGCPMTILVPVAVPVSTTIPMTVPWLGVWGSGPMGAWLCTHMVCKTPCFVWAVVLGGVPPPAPAPAPGVLPACAHNHTRSWGKQWCLAELPLAVHFARYAGYASKRWW